MQSPIGKVVVERPEVGTHATNYHFGDIFGEEDRAFLIRKMALKSHAGIYPTFPCTNTFNLYLISMNHNYERVQFLGRKKST